MRDPGPRSLSRRVSTDGRSRRRVLGVALGSSLVAAATGCSLLSDTDVTGNQPEAGAGRAGSGGSAGGGRGGADGGKSGAAGNAGAAGLGGSGGASGAGSGVASCRGGVSGSGVGVAAIAASVAC